jgi:hypothetical protein
MKSIILTFLLFFTSISYGQVKVNGKVPYTNSQEMLLKSASEQKMYAKERYKSVGFGLTGIGIISLGLAIPDNGEVLPVIGDVEVLYAIGGVLTLVGAYYSIKAPIHLKRSAAYLEASVTGVRITF